jgi:hypothetical protein
MCWALVTMGFVLLIVFVLSAFDQRAAYRLLQLGQSELFEGEDQHGRKTSPVKRGYISPYMRNQVAQSQHWRCRICGRELDASFDLDHIIPLSSEHWQATSGANDRSNLQAICHSPCHIEKTAREASSRPRGRS